MLHPSQQIFGTNFVDEASAGQANIMTSLDNINAIVHIKMTLALEWDGKLVIEHIEKNIGSMCIRGHYCKIVYLPHKDNTFAINNPQILARFMNCRGEAKFL